MKIPKKITIRGKLFVVKSGLSEKQMAKMMGDGSCPWGAMNYSDRIIWIRAHANPEEEIITFLHECRHAMHYMDGMAQLLSPQTIEMDCETSAAGFYDVFRAIMPAPRKKKR